MPDPTNLTVYTSSRAGVKPTMAAADANGNTFPNTGEEVIFVQNQDTTDATLTIAVPKTMDGLAVAPRTVVVPDGEARIIGPFPTGTYNNDASKVSITYDKVTDLGIVIFKKGVG